MEENAYDHLIRSNNCLYVLLLDKPNKYTMKGRLRENLRSHRYYIYLNMFLKIIYTKLVLYNDSLYDRTSKLAIGPL